MMRNSISFIVLGAFMALSSVQAATVEQVAIPSFNIDGHTVVAKKNVTTADNQTTAEAEPSLFVAYNPQAVASEPTKTTAEGHSNVVTRLEQIKQQANNNRQKQAVSNSRAVQRAVSYTVRGKRYTTLADSDGFVQTGRASWYGKRFHGRKTASGERFDMNALTAAHKELPLGTKIEVTNNANGKSVVVTVNDRGPFHGNRVLDLSKAAAKQLGVVQKGTANVTIRAL